MDIKELNEYCVANLEMELIKLDESGISTVEETIASYLKGIKTDEGCKDNEQSMLEVIAELKPFVSYSCIYSFGATWGGSFSQGFVIIDEDMNYKGFVRTV
ncbi:hypothetical protein [Clostridium tagluense]|uniref:hypothetical protein n=1 Tax=Clostridium tagluense TaxID=360422 RepID=UPI001C6DD9C6|nr:hypothetical protein [Clostridium tagluense]MBW9154877.1 hypothetical protein [Clostridium tagluense]WLC64332.1 hypothetical protein KTC93_15840 [Clostridium tagluense]